MSTPTAEPVAKPQPEGKASFSFRHPFARATKEDVARGVTNSFSLLLFFFWPLAVLYFLATLPIQLWRIRHRLYPFHIRVRRVLFWNTILLYVTIGGLFFRSDYQPGAKSGCLPFAAWTARPGSRNFGCCERRGPVT